MNKATLLLLGTCAFAATSSASIVVTFSARQVSDSAGNALAAGSLVQLVNLGADGVFNPINVDDGSGSGSARWVSGDDSLLGIPFKINATTAGDFASTDAFDMVNGTDTTLGRISRQMLFGDSGAPTIPAGTKLGIRWFPGLLASNFGSITLAAGQSYGQFTRQAPETLLRTGTTYWSRPRIV